MRREEKKQLRADLFRHLDGIVTAPTAYILHKNGVLNFLLKNKKASLQTLPETFKANEGYLNIALRVLASQGWLDYNRQSENDIEVRTNSDQYIVEIEVFHKVAAEVGLYPVEKYFKKFPNSELATVSINLLREN